MTDKDMIEALYREMYKAMVEKDTATLNRVHADNFVLTHMTGMHQSKQEYIKAIAGGTLNYYSAEHEQMDIKVDGNHATEGVIHGVCNSISNFPNMTAIGCSPTPRQVHIKKIRVRPASIHYLRYKYFQISIASSLN